MDKTPQDTNTHASTHSPHSSAGFGISDKELAKQDNFQRYLTLTLDWLVANKVLIIMLVGVLVLSGVGYVSYQQVKRSTQLKIQDQYFVIEKDYLKIKSDFEEAEQQAKAEAAKKTEKVKKGAKAEDAPKADLKKQATGDLEKDYGAIVTRFNDLHSANPKTIPAKITSLVLADLYWEYKKLDRAVEVLEKSADPAPSTLVDYMILKKLSATQLSLGQFDKVIKANQSVVQNSKYPFMTSYFKIQTALAHEGLKQWDQAETQYREVIAKGETAMNLPEDEQMKKHFGTDLTAAEQAQKYLLLLRLKKSEDQAGT